MNVRIVFGTIALAVVLSSCAHPNADSARMPPVMVEASPAVRQDISTSLTLDGQVTPLLTSTLSSPQSGNVLAVYVNEGDRVRRGQLLAKIDAASLRAQLTQAQGQLAAAQGKLEGSTITQPIQSTQYSVGAGQARARLSADQAALQNAKLLYESDLKLYPQGYISQTVLEQARATYIAALQQVSQDQAALQAAQANLGQSQADLSNVRANQGLLEQAKGLVEQLRTEIEQTNVYAPFEGVVTARLLDPGAFAGPNQPILTLSHLATVYINASVPDDALAYVHVGREVTFTTSSLPAKKFRGIISNLNAAPTQGTLSYRARIRYPNPDELLRGGMLVSITVPKEKRSAVIVVPRSAVFQSDNHDAVFVAEQGKAVRVPVRVGLQTDTSAEVRGLSEGAQVITMRPDSLQDGSPVVVGNGAK